MLFSMSAHGDLSELLAQARSRVALRMDAQEVDGAFSVRLSTDDGRVMWPDYARGKTEPLALLAAEQRYLVEEVGRGSVPGSTYERKALERLRRWSQGDGEQ